MVRASACRAEGREFESRRERKDDGGPILHNDPPRTPVGLRSPQAATETIEKLRAAPSSQNEPTNEPPRNRFWATSRRRLRVRSSTGSVRAATSAPSCQRHTEPSPSPASRQARGRVLGRVGPAERIPGSQPGDAGSTPARATVSTDSHALPPFRWCTLGGSRDAVSVRTVAVSGPRQPGAVRGV
jgi:hypothetical protein